MKTSKKHFELFKKTFLEWAHKLGFSHWDLYILHQNDGPTYARIFADPGNCLATLEFCQDWEDGVRVLSDEQIKLVAKHEAMHLLLSPVLHEARLRYTKPDAVEDREEEVVQKLEKLL